MSNEDEKTSHLLGMSLMNNKLRAAGIKPIWIFDGEPLELKKQETARRRTLKTFYQQQKQLSLEKDDMVSALKYSKRSIFLTNKEIDSSKTLLTLSGVDYLESCQEADGLLAYAVDKGLVDWVVSSDSDLLAYGIPRVLKKLSDPKAYVFEDICLDDILENLGIDHREFVDFCILIGNDYNSAANKLGPVTAHKLIQKHRTLESVFDSEANGKFDLSCYENYDSIREIFLGVRNGHFSPEFWDFRSKSKEEIFELSKNKNSVFEVRGQFNESRVKEFLMSKNFTEATSDRLIANIQGSGDSNQN